MGRCRTHLRRNVLKAPDLLLLIVEHEEGVGDDEDEEGALYLDVCEVPYSDRNRLPALLDPKCGLPLPWKRLSLVPQRGEPLREARMCPSQFPVPGLGLLPPTPRGSRRAPVRLPVYRTRRTHRRSGPHKLKLCTRPILTSLSSESLNKQQGLPVRGGLVDLGYESYARFSPTSNSTRGGRGRVRLLVGKSSCNESYTRSRTWIC